jgi:flagellar biosynthesis protein FliR
MFGDLFVTAVRMAAPFTLLALASNFAVGVLNRLIPQMNVMLFSFPITILLGLITFYLVAPELLDFIEEMISSTGEKTVALLRAL